jgi:cellulose biosynthesis protein BcsQ
MNANDLFNFLKDNGPEVIAAFVVGFIAAAILLSYAFYLFFSSHYSKKLTELEADVRSAKENLKDAQQAQADLKRKHKERKSTLETQATEVARLRRATDEARKNEEKAAKAAREAQKQIVAEETKYSALAEKYNKLGRVAMSLKKQVTSLNDQAKLFEKLQGQLWEKPLDSAKVTPFRPLATSKAVIISLINLKGGVGKTTLTANIAATYCRQMNKRVLVIDLDFQASLAGLCLSADHFDQRKLGVDQLFSNPAAAVATLAFANAIGTQEPNLRVLSASENLPNVEERARATWLLNADCPDLRCVFRRVLHDPVFEDNFDVILIDCPPRWTTSSINAMACCDYVLVPTLLDRVSAEAVPRLLKWLKNLRATAPELYGNFKVLGVMGNRAFPRNALVEQERIIWESSPAKCQLAWGEPVAHLDTIIREKSEFHRAADRREFAAMHKDLQPIFLELVEEIEARRSAYEGR